MLYISVNLKKQEHEKNYFKVVSSYFSILVFVVFCRTRHTRIYGRSAVLRALARYNIIILNSNQTKKNNMSIGFFIIGGIIFSIYMVLTFWNIFYSNRKQREESYPNVHKHKQASAETSEDKTSVKNKN